MSVRGKHQLSRGISDFLYILDSLDPPSVINTLKLSLKKAMKKSKPVAAMNRSVGQIYRHTDKKEWKDALVWLSMPEIGNKYSAVGATWALDIWQLAIIRIADGNKANVAFGMNKAGNPKGLSFSTYMDSAIYWQILELDKTISRKIARDTALLINQNSSSIPLSERDVRKTKARLPNFDISNPVVNALTKMIIEEKYGL